MVSDADYPNNDGIDPNEGSCPLTVDDVFIHDSDDSFAGGWDADCAGVSFSNAVISNGWNGSAMKLIANKLPVTMRDYSFENIDVLYGSGLIAINSGVGGGRIDNISFKSIRSEETSYALMGITVRDGVCGAPATGAVSGVTLLDVRSSGIGSLRGKVCAQSDLIGSEPSAAGRHDVSGVDFRAVRFGKWSITSPTALANTGFRRNEFVDRLTFSTVLPTQINVRATATSALGGKAEGFVVTRSRGSTAAPLEIAYRLIGSARDGIDFAALPGTVTIPAGAASAKVSVRPLVGRTAEVRTVAMILQPRQLSDAYVLGPQAQRQIAITP